MSDTINTKTVYAADEVLAIRDEYGRIMSITISAFRQCANALVDVHSNRFTMNPDAAADRIADCIHILDGIADLAELRLKCGE